MTVFGIFFYVLAALTAASTGLAVTRRDPVHAVVYLVVSFLASSMLFYLLGAPIIAALQVIISAGAIMVLFLFVIITLRGVSKSKERPMIGWAPAGLLALLFLWLTGFLIARDPDRGLMLQAAMAPPAEFGRFLFERYWLAVEVVSLLLFIVLVAAIELGKRRTKGAREADKDRLASST